MSESRSALLSGRARYRRSRNVRARTTALGSALALLAASFIGGMAPAMAAPSDLEIIPPTLDFETIYAGDTAQIDVELKNSGADSQDVSGLVFTSADPEQLSVSAGTCVDQLAAQEVCKFVLELHPNVVDDDFTATVTASMTGFSDTITLSPPVLDPLTVSDTNLQWPDILVGEVEDLQVDVVNSSSRPIQINSTRDSSPDPFPEVSLETSCDSQFLAPGEGCIIKYWFQPTVRGPASASVATKLLGVERTITMSGRGIEADWGVSPTTLDFESIPVGSSRSLDLTVTNQSLDVLAIPVHALDLGEHFTVDSSCEVGLELAAEDSCIITVTFTPTDENLFESDGYMQFGDWGFEIHTEGTGTMPAKPEVLAVPEDTVDEKDPAKEPAGPELAATGASNVERLLGLTTLLLVGGALTLRHSRRNAHFA